MKVGQIASIISDKIDSGSLTRSTYLSTENMLPNMGGFVIASNLPTTRATSVKANDILLSNIRPYFRKMIFSTFCGGCSNDVICLRARTANCIPKYLFYSLSTDDFFSYFAASCKGTKMPRGDKQSLLEYDIPLPDAEKQQHIVSTIGSVDDLIEKDEEIISGIKKERASLFCVFSSKCKFSSPLIDLVNCQGGAQPPKSMHIFQPKNGYIRFVQNRDYSDSSHLTFIPISKRNKTCDREDIMIDKYGEAGMVRYGIPGAFNVALMKVSAKSPEQKEYLRDFLLQKTIRKMLSQSSMAST